MSLQHVDCYKRASSDGDVAAVYAQIAPAYRHCIGENVARNMVDVESASEDNVGETLYDLLLRYGTKRRRKSDIIIPGNELPGAVQRLLPTLADDTLRTIHEEIVHNLGCVPAEYTLQASQTVYFVYTCPVITE